MAVRTVPVPVDGLSKDVLGNIACVCVGLAVCRLAIRLERTRLVRNTGLLQCLLKGCAVIPLRRMSLIARRNLCDAPWPNVQSGFRASHSASILSISAPDLPSASAAAMTSASARSGEVTPLMNSWSTMSTVLESSFADSASVRAMRSIVDFMRSSWKRAAMRRETCADAGTRTLPARCPHFFPPTSWSSRWMADAPYIAHGLYMDMKSTCGVQLTDSANSLTSFITVERPPCLPQAGAYSVSLSSPADVQAVCLPHIRISYDRTQVIDVWHLGASL